MGRAGRHPARAALEAHLADQSGVSEAEYRAFATFARGDTIVVDTAGPDHDMYRDMLPAYLLVQRSIVPA